MTRPIESLIDVAARRAPADILIKNAQVYNSFTKTFGAANVAVKDGYVAAVGQYEDGVEVVDAKGAFLVPGFIDGHVHIESAMASPLEFAKTMAQCGTTAVIADPHEIANVAGLRGLEYILAATEDIPLRVFVMLPSCVPASPLEMGGAVLTAADLAPLLKHPRVLGLGEIMNYPGVIFKDPEVMAKLLLADGRPIDGHAPKVEGDDLVAYAAAGIRSDHECMTPEEARQRMALGMSVMLREGSAAKNLVSLLGAVDETTAPCCFMATDDRHAEDLVEQGHLNYLVKLTRANSPLSLPTVLNLASLNCARHYGLRDLGAIAPGFKADLALYPNLDEWKPAKVWQAGRLVFDQGQVVGHYPKVDESAIRNSVKLPPLNLDMLKIKAGGHTQVRVIGLIPHQLLTEHLVMSLPVEDGEFKARPQDDILKIAVFERHRLSGHVGVSLIKGLGLKKGAVASTVAHDSHNLVVAGADDADMLLAASEIQKIGGGLVIAEGGRIVDSLPLPLAGLLSDQPMPQIKSHLARMQASVRQLGLAEGNDPFMTLAFMSLPVIPHLKITENGLADVDAFKIVPNIL